MNNDIDIPNPIPSVDVKGERIEEGAFVLTVDCYLSDSWGEVMGAANGQVQVAWPYPNSSRYSLEWHPASEIYVMHNDI